MSQIGHSPNKLCQSDRLISKGRLQNMALKFNVNVFMEHNPMMTIPYDYLKNASKADVRKNSKSILSQIQRV